VDRTHLQELLARVQAGELALDDAVDELRRLPFEALDHLATVDHHRPLRAGVPEVVLGEWKSAEQIATILAALAKDGSGALATRVDADKAAEILARIPGAVHHALARAVVVPGDDAGRCDAGRGTIAVVAAGTSDLPVAEEAAVTAEFLGHQVDRITDVGVAGLQRLVAQAERLRAAEVAIVVAGMEGALPSVVAGLIDRPLIAVPTSVGYGVGLGGYVAMLGMLSSCSPGVTVVNIDNGFGAAVAAALINRRRPG
jgi:pyridinium-3,5-biscarboxylic acid mononucleotide synthase